MTDGGGLHYRIADGGIPEDDFSPERNDGNLYVRAPIAPGSVPLVPIESWQRLADGQRVAIEQRHSTVALDGERSFSVNPGNLLEIEVRRDGPPVVNVDATLRHAAAAGRVPGLARR